MAAEPDDPFAVMPWRHRFGLRRRLKKAWRQGLAEQRAATLRRLRGDMAGAVVVSVDHRSTITEITFADGTLVRLWLCYRPAVKALHGAVLDGQVALAQADAHGHLWALYFATLEGRLPLICRDIRVRQSQGGVSQSQDPRLPATPLLA